MIVVPFQAAHLRELQLQKAQAWGTSMLTEQHAAGLEETHAFTAMVGGQIVGVGGAYEIWEGRALLWSFIDGRAGPHFVAIHRATMRFLETLPYRRIEAEVDCDFLPGHRWIKMLGFELEAERLRKYRVDGGDSALYARIR